MSIWNVILADGSGGKELFYVVAVLILAGLGAIADKLKPKGQEGESPAKPSPRPQARGSAPVRGPRRPEERPARPARPVSRPVARPVSRPTSPPVFQREQPAIPVAPPRPQRPQSDRARRAAAEMAALQARPVPVVDTQSRFAEMKRKTKAARARTESVTGRGGTTALGRLSRQDLRRAIVLNEILQPPLALREE